MHLFVSSYICYLRLKILDIMAIETVEVKNDEQSVKYIPESPVNIDDGQAGNNAPVASENVHAGKNAPVTSEDGQADKSALVTSEDGQADKNTPIYPVTSDDGQAENKAPDNSSVTSENCQDAKAPSECSVEPTEEEMALMMLMKRRNNQVLRFLYGMLGLLVVLFVAIGIVVISKHLFSPNRAGKGDWSLHLI